MAIDSVGGGGRDAGYEVRRRALEEERARELDRIEKRHKEEVARVEESRSKALQNIYENQSEEVGTHQSRADDRVTQAKKAADNRIRDFEQDAARMSDEAKRQFQSKADLLTKNAEEMDAQREFLLKQHNDSMKQVKEQREQAHFEQDYKLKRDSMKTYQEHKGRMNDLQARANEELSNMKQNVQGQRDAARAEAHRAIEDARSTKDRGLASMAHELEHRKREGAQALEHDRISKEVARTTLQHNYDTQVGDLRRENQTAVNRTHRDGQKMISDVKDEYYRTASEMLKDSREKMRTKQTGSAASLQTIENNAKFQEKLAREGYEHKKNVLLERRDKTIGEMTKEAEAHQTRVAETYKGQAQMLETGREAQLKEHLNTVQGELAVRRDQGARQLNALTQANAKKVASHADRTSDPFYRVHQFAASVDHAEKEIVVRVKVPEHEKDSVRLTLQAEGLVLSAARRFEDRMTNDDGRKVSTNAFQSYSESFPVTGKLEMKRMSREYADGHVTFRIPKA